MNVVHRTEWPAAKIEDRWPVFVADEAGEVRGFSTYGPFRPWPAYQYSGAFVWVRRRSSSPQTSSAVTATANGTPIASKCRCPKQPKMRTISPKARPAFEEALESTVSVQIALLTAGVATARVLIQEDVEPAVVCGLSLMTDKHRFNKARANGRHLFDVMSRGL